jgi:hypothetical protein
MKKKKKKKEFLMVMVGGPKTMTKANPRHFLKA